MLSIAESIREYWWETDRGENCVTLIEKEWDRIPNNLKEKEYFWRNIAKAEGGLDSVYTIL